MPEIASLEKHYHIPFPRERVWPVLRNTDWMNRSMGMPPVEYAFQARPEGGARVKGETKMMGLRLRWSELPFEWLEPEFFEDRRIFETGPLRAALVRFELRDAGRGGTDLRLMVEADPRNAMGAFLARNVLSRKVQTDVARIARHVERHLRGEEANPLPRLATHTAEELPLRTGLDQLRRIGLDENLVRRLEGFLRESPDVALGQIRPFALARVWQLDRWEVLRLLMHATRAGLLDLRWEILCPNCRSSQAPATKTLRKLRSESHCDLCQIRYDAEFDRSVELKFSVNAAVRPQEERIYCLAGPGGTPHVLSQVRLAPGEQRDWSWPSGRSHLRIRSPQTRTPLEIGDAAAESVRPTRIICGRDAFEPNVNSDASNTGAVRLVNPNDHDTVVVFEETRWSEDILTAAQATNWQDFRDLFSSEVLSPNEQISVGSQVVLFTDLRGSTAMYGGLGDAPAYALVRNHFRVLTEAVENHHGAVVKTIGDAVMAVFTKPDEALAAVEEMHRRLPEAEDSNRESSRLRLKSALHLGTCLAVNANDKLDYFGTAINLAARLVNCCEGGDLTVSEAMYARPEFQPFLADLAQAPERLEVKFRGFDSPHEVWRVRLQPER